MPCSQSHDRISIATGLPVVATAFYCLLWQQALALCLAYFFSCFMLSPDLDLHSEPYNRWWILKWVWKPYSKLIPHRSWASHSPIFGTLIRMAYLLAIPLTVVTLSAFALPYFGAISGVSTIQDWARGYNLSTLETWVEEHWRILASTGAGLEAGSLVHISADALVSFYKRLRRWFAKH